MEKRCATPGTATSPNHAESSGAPRMVFGLRDGVGSWNVWMAPNWLTESWVLMTPERLGHPPSCPWLEVA